MRKVFKIIAASVVFAGCSTTAFAGAQDTAFNTQAMKIKTSTSVQKTTIKKVVRLNANLPKARQVATRTARTVLFFDAQPTRSKVLKTIPSKTSTPNLFK